MLYTDRFLTVRSLKQVMQKVEGERIWITDLDVIEDRGEDIFEQVEYSVNLSSWCDSKFAQRNRYAHISIPDAVTPPDVDDPKYADYALACDFVWSLMQREEGDILVHCAAGVSRSVSVAAAVLARKNDTSVREEVENVREARGKALRPAPENVKFAERWVDEMSA